MSRKLQTSALFTNYLCCSGRGQASSTFQEFATQSADISADDIADQAAINDGFGVFDDLDNGSAGMMS